tara:strand:+ start:126 stop:320 length:195 start_codon:yes stop_codon:yes gene_type:complete
MNTIKFIKEGKIRVNGRTYKPYTICDLPTSFGQTKEDIFGNKYPAIDEWLKLPSPNKGLIYIAE